MTMAIAAPASRTASTLARPSSPATTEGRPKTPLPMIKLTTSATRLQRPMARCSWLGRFGEVVSILRVRFVSQTYDPRTALARDDDRNWMRRASRPLGQPRACPERSRTGGCACMVCGDFGANGHCTIGCGGKSGARNQDRDRAGDSRRNGLKSLASGAIQRLPMRKVTFETEVMLELPKRMIVGHLSAWRCR